MKVLMLYNDYLQAGGERVSVATEFEALRAAGVDVQMLSVSNEDLAASGAIGKIKATFPREQARTQVAAAIAEFEPDLVHAQNLFPQLGAGAVRAIRDAGLPWVRTIRNYRKGCIAGTLVRDGQPCTDCAGSLGRLPGVIHGCYQGSRAASVGATNYAYWDAAAENEHPPASYILISQAMCENIEWALNATPNVTISHNAVSAEDRKRRRMEERRYDIAFIGRLTREKGVHIALEMARIQRSRRFIFVGSGPMLGEVEAAAVELENVECRGVLSPHETAEVMENSRLVIVPSMWEEPFGRVAAEALAYGAVPVVSSLGGLPEIAEPLDPALVVRSSEAKDWSRTAERILCASSIELQDRSDAANDRWRLHFSPGSLATRLAAIYSAALSL
ncbi:glycosyltransferase [Herbiconiux sp. 11R-BC]|uniref:glycosyltransferase n=1 Tax=Herbiconiux sp. 11R-BC TaxID=3111637 RepID=UPI003C070BD3